MPTHEVPSHSVVFVTGGGPSAHTVYRIAKRNPFYCDIYINCNSILVQLMQVKSADTFNSNRFSVEWQDSGISIYSISEWCCDAMWCAVMRFEAEEMLLLLFHLHYYFHLMNSIVIFPHSLPGTSRVYCIKTISFSLVFQFSFMLPTFPLYYYYYFYDEYKKGKITEIHSFIHYIPRTGIFLWKESRRQRG